MTLKFSSAQPDSELDGFQQFEERFRGTDPDDVIAVVVMSQGRLVQDPPAPVRPSVRIKHIEPVDGADEETVRGILRARYAQRTGNEPLPFDEFENVTELPIPEGGDSK